MIPVTSSAPAQTYCHAFVFDNRREAAEINTTLGNAFRLSFYKRTYKRPNMTGSGADKAQSHHTHSSSSTGTTDSDAILRKKRLPGEQNHQPRAPIKPLQPGSNIICSRDQPGSNIICSRDQKSPVDLRTALKDTDLKSRIENWLDGSATPPPRSSNQRWKRSGSCEPHSIPERQMEPTAGIVSIYMHCVYIIDFYPFSNQIITTALSTQENLRRPSRVVTDQMAIPPEIKDQFWFQGGIPRHIALECLLHECEGAFIVRMSQTQKGRGSHYIASGNYTLTAHSPRYLMETLFPPGCYALSLRGANGTYHYLIYRSNEGFYFPGSGRVFADMESLIHHHCNEQEGLACKLTLNRNNPLYKDDPDSSDFEEEIEDPDYEQPPEDGFTTLLPSKHAKPRLFNLFSYHLPVKSRFSGLLGGVGNWFLYLHQSIFGLTLFSFLGARELLSQHWPDRFIKGGRHIDLIFACTVGPRWEAILPGKSGCPVYRGATPLSLATESVTANFVTVTRSLVCKLVEF
eukprot:sb/3463895/